MTHQLETARALLHRHGLPEDIIDGALCLHAQELAAVQRAALAKTDDPVFYEGEAGWLINLIEPSRTPAAVSAAVAPPTQAAALRDRIAAALYKREHVPGEPDWEHAYPADREVFEAMADAVLAVLPEPTDRTTAEAALAAVETALGDTLLPDAREEALARLMTVLPPTTDRAAVYREAADRIEKAADEHPDQYVPQGLYDAADRLRRMADETATETPAAEPGETDEERADREATERDHARGDHTYCGVTCEAMFPSDMLRNTILYRAIPGSQTMLAELERRAAAEAAPDTDLPARLEAALTERYTSLGNPFSRMRRQEKGPDGWPAERPVGPHHVAEALRELLATDEPERCAHCTHPKRDHDGRADHRAKHSPLVAGDPWCHACNARCDYAAGARQDGAET